MKEKTGLEYVLQEINKIIIEEDIKVGEKLPSERYLKEQLNVSRQSVREALRALEMLGVIYVRIGEGTFLADFKNHKLFDLIGKYIVRTDEQRMELLDIQHIIEAHINEKYHGEKSVSEDDNQILKTLYAVIKSYTDNL